MHRAPSFTRKAITNLQRFSKKFYQTDAQGRIRFDLSPSTTFKLHIPKNVEGFTGPKDHIYVSKEECLAIFRQMTVMRKFEIAADLEYKQRMIRGFCHLYDGQEAVCAGIEASLTKEDHVITAYRDHAHQLARGDTPESTMAELFGKHTGCSHGKGGSMHMYLRSNNFFGGNGIVGAQVPVGTGLAFGLKYWANVIDKKPNTRVSVTYYGDGASNQGQVYEAYNMAALWKLPVIYVIEDNQYGMGTSAKKSSANPEYYTRGDVIPGIWADGMDVFAIKECARFAKEWALAHGPIVLHVNTYRYHGHSMSDPGISYRSRDEIKEVRVTRDPITKMKQRLLDNKIVQESELEQIEAKVTEEIAACVQFAKDSPLPPVEELPRDVYLDKEYTVKGTSAAEIYSVKGTH